MSAARKREEQPELTTAIELFLSANTIDRERPRRRQDQGLGREIVIETGTPTPRIAFMASSSESS